MKPMTGYADVASPLLFILVSMLGLHLSKVLKNGEYKINKMIVINRMVAVAVFLYSLVLILNKYHSISYTDKNT